MQPNLCKALVGELLICGLILGSAKAATVRYRVSVTKESHDSGINDNSEVAVWLVPLSGKAPQSAALRERGQEPQLEIVQKHKQFHPHLLVLQVGTEVNFPNKDPFFHNVFSLYDGKRFDLGLYEAGSSRRVLFDRIGICYIFCNIHPQMSAVVLVVDTPYYAVSNAAGEIDIPDVPPGEYQLHVWNEHASTRDLKGASRAVSVEENTSFAGTIRLRESLGLALTHKNKYGRSYDPQVYSDPLYEPQAP